METTCYFEISVDFQRTTRLLYPTWENSSIKSLLLSGKEEKGNVLQTRTINKDVLFLNVNGLYDKRENSTPQH
jgi:hypothetical protein